MPRLMLGARGNGQPLTLLGQRGFASLLLGYQPGPVLGTKREGLAEEDETFD